MSELKTCPFCGKAATEESFYSGDGFPLGCSCVWNTNTGEDAEKRWNTRPLEDALLNRAEKSEAKNKRLRDALERFAKLDLTSPISDAIAWDILNARAALKAGEE